MRTIRKPGKSTLIPPTCQRGQGCCKQASRMPLLHYQQCSFCKGKRELNLWSHQKLKLDCSNSCVMSNWYREEKKSYQYQELSVSKAKLDEHKQKTNKKCLSWCTFCKVQLICWWHKSKNGLKKIVSSTFDLSIFNYIRNLAKHSNSEVTLTDLASPSRLWLLGCEHVNTKIHILIIICTCVWVC